MMVSNTFFHQSFQFILISGTVTWLVIACWAFPWDSIEEMNKVDNVINMHVNLAGLLMSYTYIKQLTIPMVTINEKDGEYYFGSR